MCRRRDSDWVHSQRRFQASGREISVGMALTLAESSQGTSPATLGDPPPVNTAGLAPMEKFVIEGGVPLSGTIVPAGNKNGALPILAACLLTDDEVILRNVPRIRDVEAMAALLQELGATVEWLGTGEMKVDASAVRQTEVDPRLAERIRA